MPFGYAKTIRIDFSRFAHSRRDLIAVLAAGPAANLVLAIVAALALHAVGGLPDHVNGLAAVHDYQPSSWQVVVVDNLMNLVRMSLLLAAINIVPLAGGWRWSCCRRAWRRRFSGSNDTA